jgi:hypothetical protein
MSDDPMLPFVLKKREQARADAADQPVLLVLAWQSSRARAISEAL